MPYKDPEKAKRKGIEYRLLNKEKLRLRERARYHEAMRNNPERERATRKAWRDSNPAIARNSANKWRTANQRDVNAKQKARIAADPLTAKTRLANWRERNKDSIRRKRKAYETENKSRISARKKARTNADPSLRLIANQRTRVGTALATMGTRKSANTWTLLGCAQLELARHLESLFWPGMTWQNKGEWVVDHILPCASFNLTLSEQQTIAFHWSNLQPLWRDDNHRKNDRLDWTPAESPYPLPDRLKNLGDGFRFPSTLE